jgi:hypothetical protein
VLDEIVDAWPSAWVKERLAYIINSRYNARRATIITTTLGLGIDHRPRIRKGVGATDDASIQREFESTAQQIALRRTLAEFDNFGAQIASRFFEMCRPIEFADVPDFRRTMKTAGNAQLFE